MRLVYLGTPALARPCLRALVEAGHEVALVVTQPDRPVGRGRKLQRGPVAALADELGLSVAQPARVGEMAGDLEALGAQAAVLVAYGQLLPPAVLEAFPLGAVNLHPSLLPLLRGAAPINWALLNGFSQTGVSTMYMAPELDAGDIILQQSTPLGPQETAGSLSRRLALMGAELMVRSLAAVQEGSAPRLPQDPARATLAPRLAKGDGLLDWSLPAVELDRRVRGLDPWPAAFTTLRGAGLKLFAPTALREDTPSAEPGAILELPDGDQGLLWVACGSGALGLGQVQAAGKKQMPAGQFARGARLAAGEKLGES